MSGPTFAHFLALVAPRRDGTPDAGETPSSLASAEAGPPMPPRPVERGAAGPLPRPVRHLIARWQQEAADRAERRAAARSTSPYYTRSVDS